jgi:type VI protein secretion system component VasA
MKEEKQIYKELQKPTREEFQKDMAQLWKSIRNIENNFFDYWEKEHIDARNKLYNLCDTINKNVFEEGI